MVKKLVESVMLSTVFDVTEVLTGAGCYSPRIRGLPVSTIPDQNRSWHTTLRTPDTKISSHLPDLSPQPHGLPWSLDSSQQVIGENKETQHRRQLVTVRSVVLADRDFFSCWAVVGEKEPNKPDRYVQSVVAQDHG